MTSSLLFLVALLAAPDSSSSRNKAAQEHLQRLHLEEAENWQMAIGNDGDELAKLDPTPVFSWTNPIKSNVQSGAVYVWTWRSRPVVIGRVFSHPENDRRVVHHEFHSLCAEPLHPRRAVGGTETWEPKAPAALAPLPDCSPPEASASRRLLQMRSLGREFSAHSVDYRKERWELRLLSQPLYRYKQVEGDVIDGALFAFVTSAGTDPEIILALEARRSPQGEEWFYRLLRFSDCNLYVDRHGAEIWSSVRDDKNQMYFNPDHTYRLIRDTFIEEIPELKP